MSRLTDLIRNAKERDPDLGAELEREFKALSGRRAFGLNFERHRPEAVELPQRPVRKGDKVRILPPRGFNERGDQQIWIVRKVVNSGDARTADLVALDNPDLAATAAGDDLVVIAQFRDPIYPGLQPTGTVEHGGDKPFHTVINGENFHVLKALSFTHRGKVDAIYIDPPYNTGAKDWKYNNDYVEGDDLYRHSKWLAFMERRLLLARELLNPADSVLIVTIDEKEYLRLGLLLEQTFPEAAIQMVTSVTNRAGSTRGGRFTRVDEYVFCAFFGTAQVGTWRTNMLSDPASGDADGATMPNVWFSAVRVGSGSALRNERPNLFYAVHLDQETGALHSIGTPLALTDDRSEYSAPAGTIAIWPLSTLGREQTWRFGHDRMREFFERGTARLGRRNDESGWRAVTYLRPGTIEKIDNGSFEVLGRSEEGALELGLASGVESEIAPSTVWNLTGHYARDHGSKLLSRLIPDRNFPFPKSLYAVEDSLRFFVKDKPDAVIIDFFGGSGTTAHAVARLNRQDNGNRQAIIVTNNEVSADEQRALRQTGLRAGDPQWEALGICDHITKPRIEAAITGLTPNGDPIKGRYTFTDEFPMADGFEANAAFFTLTYETPVAIGHNRAFSRIAPLLWMRAGSVGRCIDRVSDTGWDLAERYAILFDLDASKPFEASVKASPGLTTVFVVTDDDRRFQAIVRRLPPRVEPVRLYESYLTNFRFTSGDGPS